MISGKNTLTPGTACRLYLSGADDQAALVSYRNRSFPRELCSVMSSSTDVRVDFGIVEDALGSCYAYCVLIRKYHLPGGVP